MKDEKVQELASLKKSRAVAKGKITRLVNRAESSELTSTSAAVSDKLA